MASDKVHLSFYRFFDLRGPEVLRPLRKRLKLLCEELNLKGTILLAPEGINAMITGTVGAVTTLRLLFCEEFGFKPGDFKEAPVPEDSFSRMLVKLKKEIITIGEPELKPHEHTAPRISPAELKKWLDEKRPLILLDTRNQYEVEIGTFKGAEPIGISTSREFATQAKSKFKARGENSPPVVTFCTGGIRCEKGAALLSKMGVKEVYQLDGGILRYFEETGGTHFDGNCFVFDGRQAVNGTLEPVPRSADPGQSFGRHRVPLDKS